MATDEELEAWRAAAVRKLTWQAQRAAAYQACYDGEQQVPVLMDTTERRAFQKFLDESQANWCNLVVDAVGERLAVTGFRFGAASDRAWLIWQASQMDADSELVQTDALVTGQAPVLVQPDDANPTGVAITAESPRQAVVLYEPGYRRRRAAGFKRFTDEEQRQTDVLILPDVIATWGPDPGTGAEALTVEDNPGAAIIEVIPQPRTQGAPRSELKAARAIQDRIHTTIFNRLVASDYAAFRQVWATGVKLAREFILDAEGKPAADAEGRPRTRLVRPYDVGVDRLLTNENPAGRFGAIPGDDLTGYLKAVEQDIQQLAAITQTPAHYLLGTVANLSADAIKASEAGLVAKIRRRARHIGEAWEDVMRTALALVGDPAAADVSAEVVWADVETRSLAQLTDALVKLAQLGVPTEVLWEQYGATPQEVGRWRGLAAEQEARTAAAQAASLGAADIAALLAQAGAPGGGPG